MMASSEVKYRLFQKGSPGRTLSPLSDTLASGSENADSDVRVALYASWLRARMAEISG